MKTDIELTRHIGKCIDSASNNWEQRYPIGGAMDDALLSDLESDLDEALRSVRELYRRRIAAAGARYGKA